MKERDGIEEIKEIRERYIAFSLYSDISFRELKTVQKYIRIDITGFL